MSTKTTGLRTVSFWGLPINEETTYGLRCDVAKLLEESDEPITLEINSPGGDFRQGVAIHDWLIANVPKLITVGLGGVDSMAVILQLAGSERVATRHTTFTLHPVADVMGAQIPMNKMDHIESMRTLDEVQRAYTEILLDRLTNPPKRKKLQRLIDETIVLDVHKALKWGLIHKII